MSRNASYVGLRPLLHPRDLTQTRRKAYTACFDAVACFTPFDVWDSCHRYSVAKLGNAFGFGVLRVLEPVPPVL